MFLLLLLCDTWRREKRKQPDIVLASVYHSLTDVACCEHIKEIREHVA